MGLRAARHLFPSAWQTWSIPFTSWRPNRGSFKTFYGCVRLPRQIWGVAAKDLIDSKHSDLFQALSSDELPTTLDTASILTIVMASASSYPSTASRLVSIRDVPVPAAELSAQLIDLAPRIAKLESLQTAQDSDIAELRERSAAAIQRWYTVTILEAGESWANLESRVEQVEQKARMMALARRLDDDMV